MRQQPHEHRISAGPVRDTLTRFGAVTVGRKAFEPTSRWKAVTDAGGTGPGGFYHLVIPLAGSVRLHWADREVSSEVGDLLLHDVTRVSSAHFRPPSPGAPFETAVAAVPRFLLTQPQDRVEPLLGRSLAADQGIAALLADLVGKLAEHPETYRPSDRARLGLVVADLLSALLANLLDDRPVIAPSGRDALLQRIQDFVQEHLRDPELTPREIAARHHISTSYLFRLFQERDTTVAGHIRAQRLERARRDLLDPALRQVPISSIAARWGFTQAANFSRAFRRAYGLPPRELRREPTGR